MFGRATITLGIGPHSSYIVNFIMYVSCNVLATLKWHCPVLAIYSSQLFYSFLRFFGEFS